MSNTRNFTVNDKEGNAINTISIQKAIDEASSQGGGRVVITAGLYKTGTIWLKSNVELHLEEGAVILGSDNLDDYNDENAYPQNWAAKNEGWCAKHLIIAHECVNVAITGKGVIDGNGKSFFEEYNDRKPRDFFVWRHGYVNAKDRKNAKRPGQEIVFIECTNVRVEDVTVRDSTCWTFFFHGCMNVNVKGVKIRNPLWNANTDGFDVDTCSNVRIANCDVETGDDVFTVRGCQGRLRKFGRGCENVVISDCAGACAASGIRVGIGESSIRDIHFKNIHFREAGHALLVQSCYADAKYSGIAIKDISFENITCDDAAHAVFITGGKKDADAPLENIIFKNCRMTALGSIIVEGCGKVRPKNVIFDNFELTLVPRVCPLPDGATDWEVVGMANSSKAAVCVESADDIFFNGLSIKRAKGLPLERNQDFDIRDANVNGKISTIIPAPKKYLPRNGTMICRDGKWEELIRYEKDAGLPQEGYRMNVCEDCAVITSSTNEGAFRAKTTLRQLGHSVLGTQVWPCCEIEDTPVYRWRGYMLDEGRHFFGMETVKRTLDLMAEYKLNVFHWHLTEDQGWRLAIDKYPKLAEVASIRPGSVPYVHEGDSNNFPYGPFFYTHEQIRDIVNYAKERFITIIPEIEIPGHSRSVVAAYPELACDPDSMKKATPWWKYGICEDVVCAGNEQVTKFYEDVLDEICELFPGEVVHLGGDECPRKHWETCPKCQARVKREGLKNAAELQSSITRHFCEYLAKKGKRMMVWDEALVGGYGEAANTNFPKTAIAQSWRGVDPAKVAAENGYDTVVSPWTECYLSVPQGCRDDPFKYSQWLGSTTLPLKRVFNWDPSAEIPAEDKKHILGSEACLWTEWIHNECDLGYKSWPRAFAFAEALWSADPNRDFTEFLKRAILHRAKLLSPVWRINCAPLQ